MIWRKGQKTHTHIRDERESYISFNLATFRLSCLSVRHNDYHLTKMEVKEITRILAGQTKKKLTAF